MIGIEADRGMLLAPSGPFKNRIRAAFEFTQGGSVKLDWAAAEKVLISKFHSEADCLDVIKRFRTVRLAAENDSPVHVGALKGWIQQASGDSDEQSRRQLLTGKFVESPPTSHTW